MRRARPAADEGSTLIELLVTILIGIVVLLAVFGILDAAVPASQRVTDRAEATQAGRTAMDVVMQDLHSAVCVWQGNTTYLSPIAATSNANQVTFYRQIYAAPTVDAVTHKETADPGKSGAVRPQIVVISFAGGQLTETVYDPTNGAAPWTWNTSGPFVTQKVLASKVQQVGGAAYITYYAYDPAGPSPPTGPPPALAIGAGNVSAADLPRIVKVGIQFMAGPAGYTSNGTDHFASVSDEASLSQTVDFTSAATAAQGPKCSV